MALTSEEFPIKTFFFYSGKRSGWEHAGHAGIGLGRLIDSSESLVRESHLQRHGICGHVVWHSTGLNVENFFVFFFQ